MSNVAQVFGVFFALKSLVLEYVLCDMYHT